MTISEVATIPRICTSVSCLNAGTIRKPPPTPSRPDTTPVTAPSVASVAVQRGVQARRPVWRSSMQFFWPQLAAPWSLGPACGVSRRNMRAATSTINKLNRIIRIFSGS
ncbi:hypothetical protein SRABI112_05359 [Pseudomonas mediterranea]|nr:hypothetical protein SRABI112_05359 [Pseudomonas mediterranea]